MHKNEAEEISQNCLFKSTCRRLLFPLPRLFVVVEVLVGVPVPGEGNLLVGEHAEVSFPAEIPVLVEVLVPTVV